MAMSYLAETLVVHAPAVIMSVYNSRYIMLRLKWMW